MNLVYASYALTRTFSQFFKLIIITKNTSEIIQNLNIGTFLVMDYKLVEWISGQEKGNLIYAFTKKSTVTYK